MKKGQCNNCKNKSPPDKQQLSTGEKVKCFNVMEGLVTKGFRRTEERTISKNKHYKVSTPYTGPPWP